MDFGFGMFLVVICLLGWFLANCILNIIYYTYEQLVSAKRNRKVNEEELLYWRHKAKQYRQDLIKRMTPPPKKRRNTK